MWIMQWFQEISFTIFFNRNTLCSLDMEYKTEFYILCIHEQKDAGIVDCIYFPLHSDIKRYVPVYMHGCCSINHAYTRISRCNRVHDCKSYKADNIHAACICIFFMYQGIH